MRKIALIAAVVLVAVPGAALAAKPAHPSTPANSNANSNANATSTTGTSSKASTKAQAVKVMFVLHGTLGTYTAASGSTNGSIVVTVKSANHESSLLKNTTLTFPVSSTTKVVGTVTSGHNGTVKVRAAKNATAATLQTLTAFQAIDQGAAS
jgi:predicted lipoprotein